MCFGILNFIFRSYETKTNVDKTFSIDRSYKSACGVSLK